MKPEIRETRGGYGIAEVDGAIEVYAGDEVWGHYPDRAAAYRALDDFQTPSIVRASSHESGPTIHWRYQNRMGLQGNAETVLDTHAEALRSSLSTSCPASEITVELWSRGGEELSAHILSYLLDLGQACLRLEFKYDTWTLNEACSVCGKTLNVRRPGSPYCDDMSCRGTVPKGRIEVTLGSRLLPDEQVPPPVRSVLASALMSRTAFMDSNVLALSFWEADTGDLVASLIEWTSSLRHKIGRA